MSDNLDTNFKIIYYLLSIVWKQISFFLDFRHLPDLIKKQKLKFMTI